MNECFLFGTVIEVGKFKFIIKKDREHQSQLDIKIKLFDKNQTIVNAIAFDKTADYILRKDILNKTILIQGKLRPQYVEIYCIEGKGNSNG